MSQEDQTYSLVRRYLSLLRSWRNAGMPSEMMGLLDMLWYRMSKEEKNVTVRHIAENIVFYTTYTPAPTTGEQSSTGLSFLTQEQEDHDTDEDPVVGPPDPAFMLENYDVRCMTCGILYVTSSEESRCPTCLSTNTHKH